MLRNIHVLLLAACFLITFFKTLEMQSQTTYPTPRDLRLRPGTRFSKSLLTFRAQTKIKPVE